MNCRNAKLPGSLGWSAAVALGLACAAPATYAQESCDIPFEAGKVNNKCPYDQEKQNPCKPDEFPHLVGETHITATMKNAPGDPNFHLVYNITTTAQGATTTGVNYNYGNKSKGNFKGPENTAFRNSERLIRQGSLDTPDNWFFTETFRANKNGVHTEPTFSECRGGSGGTNPL